ncbi:MAG: nucleolar RNA-binding Nop10p family protein [Nanoarchaeota archaeon]
MKHILKCQECGKYILSEKCGCGGKAIENKPPKYSPEDKYADYRRKVKEKQWKKEGTI